MTIFIVALAFALFTCWLFILAGLPNVGITVAGAVGLLAGIAAARGRG